MTTDLTSQKCEACTIDAPKVTKEESNQLIKMLDNWIIMNEGFDYLENSEQRLFLGRDVWRLIFCNPVFSKTCQTVGGGTPPPGM